MAATMRAAYRCCSGIQKGIHQINNLKLTRSFATVVNVELEQKSAAKNKNLLEAYQKKRIVEEETQRNLGPEELKDFEQKLEEEMKKTVKRYTETELKKGTWTENSKRAGAVGRKIGMSLLWRKDGRPVRVTLIQVKMNQLLDCGQSL